MKSVDAFNSSKGFYNKDNTLSKTVLGEYLFTPDPTKGYDSLVNRQLSFLNQMVENDRNIILYLKAFWGAKEFTDLFHTNMSKLEFSSFLSSLMSSNLPVRSILLDSSVGTKSTTGTEDGLAANFLEFDAKIKDLMLNKKNVM